MSRKKLNFPRDVLLRDGAAIHIAAGAHPEFNPRFRANLLTETGQLITDVTQLITDQKKEIADTGDLTQEQNAALLVMNDKTAAARKVAPKAFPGDDVKLRQEFQIGAAKTGGYRLSAIVNRARIVLAACRNAENIPALAAKGWVAADTDELAAAISTLTGTDETQETSKTVSMDVTDDLDLKTADLLEHVTTIQSVVDIARPARDPANAAVRKEFRLDTFPPKQKKKPGTPRNLIVNPGAPGSLHADWDDTANADNYTARVTNKTTGALLAEVTVEDSQAEIPLPGVPAGTEVNVAVTAHNDKGDSAPTAPVTAIVP